MADIEQIKRWRLILGEVAEADLEKVTCNNISLSSEETIMDEALAAIYDASAADSNEAATRRAGKGASAPKIAKWLAYIRSFFTEYVVAVIQTDAIDRKSLKQLLFEPEVLKNVQHNIW